jgi:hypothetical protein
MSAPDKTLQYFDSTVCNWFSRLRLVNCGAHDGDTLAQIIGAGPPLQGELAFERDASNFKVERIRDAFLPREEFRDNLLIAPVSE